MDKSDTSDYIQMKTNKQTNKCTGKEEINKIKRRKATSWKITLFSNRQKT